MYFHSGVMVKCITYIHIFSDCMFVELIAHSTAPLQPVVMRKDVSASNKNSNRNSKRTVSFIRKLIQFLSAVQSNTRITGLLFLPSNTHALCNV